MNRRLRRHGWLVHLFPSLERVRIDGGRAGRCPFFASDATDRSSLKTVGDESQEMPRIAGSDSG
ncbi:MAG: hypothetical protein MZW92_75290 [Comamonadaceae bacterium]|nr:hypothetical protein [Comamonadaceae bacterium]